MKSIISKYQASSREYTNLLNLKSEMIKEYESEIAKLEKKIEKVREEMGSLEIPNWVDSIVEPLAKELQNRVNATSYQIYGPFGIHAQTSIYLFTDGGDDIVEDDCIGIELEPTRLREGKISYLVLNEEKSKYNKSFGTIGNQVYDKFNLPDDIDSIVELLE